MKTKTSPAKKLLAVFLSLIMAVGVAVPAFAIEPGTGISEIKEMDRLETVIEMRRNALKSYKLNSDYGHALYNLQEEVAAQEGMSTLMSFFATGMNVVRGISSVICFVSSGRTVTQPQICAISYSVKIS